jgi:hypothetical protein
MVLEEIKLNNMRCFLLLIASLSQWGCSFIPHTGIQNVNTAYLACWMYFDDSEDLKLTIKVTNRGKRTIYFDQKFVQLNMCFSNMQLQKDTCYFKGSDPISPILLIEPKFVALKKNKSYFINYEVPESIEDFVSIEMSFLFFATDSIFSCIEDKRLNSGYFLNANNLYLDWNKKINRKKYNLKREALIISSRRDW